MHALTGNDQSEVRVQQKHQYEQKNNQRRSRPLILDRQKAERQSSLTGAPVLLQYVGELLPLLTLNRIRYQINAGLSFISFSLIVGSANNQGLGNEQTTISFKHDNGFMKRCMAKLVFNFQVLFKR